MTDITKDGGDYPAYPITAGSQVYAKGLTKREFFAGQALAGILTGDYVTTNNEEVSPKDVADAAFEIADAMIAASEGGAS